MAYWLMNKLEVQSLTCVSLLAMLPESKWLHSLGPMS